MPDRACPGLDPGSGMTTFDMFTCRSNNLSKNKIETGFNIFEKVAGQDADTICQKMFVDGDNLRDICYRIVGKTGASLRQHDISWSLSQTEIPGDDDNDDR
jgi:hypothetical protein